MSTKHRVAALLSLVGVAVGALASSACGSADAASHSPKHVDRSPNATRGSSPQATNTLIQVPMPPSEMKAPEFAKLVLSAKWVGLNLRSERRCVGSKDCEKEKNPKRTLASIDAAQNVVTEVNIDNIPGEGVIVAQSKVLPYSSGSPRPDEKRYDMRGGDYRYVLVVLKEYKTDDGTYKTRKWELVRVNLADSTHRVESSGTFKRCLPEHNITLSYADFNYCPVDHERYQQLLTQLRANPTAAARATFETRRQAIRQAGAVTANGDLDVSPMWISCVHGCCIAEY